MRDFFSAPDLSIKNIPPDTKANAQLKPEEMRVRLSMERYKEIQFTIARENFKRGQTDGQIKLFDLLHQTFVLGGIDWDEIHFDDMPIETKNKAEDLRALLLKGGGK